MWDDYSTYEQMDGRTKQSLDPHCCPHFLSICLYMCVLLNSSPPHGTVGAAILSASGRMLCRPTITERCGLTTGGGG